MAMVQDELGNWYDDGESETPVRQVVAPDFIVRDTMLRPGDPYYGGEAPIDSGETVRMPDFSGGESQDHDFTKEEADALWKAGVWDQVKGLGQKALDLFKTNGEYDLKKLMALGGGLLAANKPNNAAPTGYQGKIPKYTAERQMLTAPPAGRRPGSGGIDYGGDATFRDTSGNVVGRQAKSINDLRELALMDPQSQYGNVPNMVRDRAAYWDTKPVGSDFEVAGGVLSRTGDNAATFRDAGGQTYQMNRNESFADTAKNIPAFAKAWEENYGYKTLAKGGIAGGLKPEGFVVPADVVSHAGNGSSEAGLKLLAAKYGAEPIKGEGDGMSDSIPTTIGGKQEARVANDEAFISPEMVKRIGGGDAKKGAKKLYAMMDSIRKERTGTKEQGKQIDPEQFMPGGSVQNYVDGGTTRLPTGATGSESSLSNWAGDYVTDMLGRGSALAQTPYQAYTGPLTAGPSNLQTQAFNMASGAAPSGISNALTGLSSYSPSTRGDVKATNVTSTYAAPGAFGAMGDVNYTPLSANQVSSTFQAPSAYQAGSFQNQFDRPTDRFTPGTFDTQMFGTSQAQQYMNPYLQSALNPAMDEARRQADIARMGDASRLTQAGAYGGSRQAIMESEGRRNLMDKQNQMLTSGYNTAYDKAQQAFAQDQERLLRAQGETERSRQFGATQDMTAAELQARFGLSAQQAAEQSRQFGSTLGLNAATTAADQALRASMANQSAGLTAGQANINAAMERARQMEQSRQFGYGQTADQAKTAADLALRAGTANQSAGLTAAQINSQAQIAADNNRLQALLGQGNLGLAQLNQLSSLGATERDIESEGIAADKAQFEEARLNPYKMLQFEQSLLSGMPVSAQSYNMPGISGLQQFAGGAKTVQEFLDILSGKTAATKKG